MRRAFVIRFPMSKPSDVSHLQTHVENRDVDPQEIVAIIAKTEGNGSLSDYSAETAEMAFTEYLSRTLAQSTEEIQARLAFFCEGGSEGVISPHGLAIGISETDDKTAKPRLAIGSARSRIIEPKEIGSGKQIEIIARCSEEAMAAAGLEDQAAVHSVLVVTPVPTLAEIRLLVSQGQRLVAPDPEGMAAASRQSAARGVAQALGEVNRETIRNSSAWEEGSVFASRAIVIAKQDVTRSRVLVLGNSDSWSGSLVIGHAVMKDAIDNHSIKEILTQLSLPTDRLLEPSETNRIVAALVKAEADPSGQIRGRRHVMMEDADIHHTRHIRSVVGTVVAATVGHPQIFVSAGAEGQGPIGGAPICAIVDVDSNAN